VVAITVGDYAVVLAVAGSLARVRSCSFRCPTWSGSLRPAFRLDTSAQVIHEIDDLCLGRLFRRFDFLAGLLLLPQDLLRSFVVIVEVLRIDVPLIPPPAKT